MYVCMYVNMYVSVTQVLTQCMIFDFFKPNQTVTVRWSGTSVAVTTADECRFGSYWQSTYLVAYL